MGSRGELRSVRIHRRPNRQPTPHRGHVSPSTVSVQSIFRAASNRYLRELKTLVPVALIESTAFTVVTVLLGVVTDVADSSLLVVAGTGLSLSAGAWVLSAFAAAERGIYEQGSAETAWQRVQRRLGALLGVTLVVNVLGVGVTFLFLWALPTAADEDSAFGGIVQLFLVFLVVLSFLALITNLAVSVLMVEDSQARAAWSRALELLPQDGTPRLAITSLLVLVTPGLVGIALGALFHSVTGASGQATDLVGGIAGEALLGPFVAVFTVGSYLALRETQAQEAKAPGSPAAG